MLQISRLQANSSSTKQSQVKPASPIQAAKSLGSKIWTVEFATKEIKRLIEKLNNHHSQHQAKRSPPTKLKGDFIKIESVRSRLRPAFKEFQKWPRLNLSCKLTYSPFDNAVSNVQGNNGPVNVVAVPQIPTADNNRMTRKTSRQVGNTTNNNKATQATATNTKQLGYCELCKLDYEVLANHLQSNEHLEFVRNETNFTTLDNLINSSGANIETFLKENSELVVSLSVEQSKSEIEKDEKSEKLADKVLEKEDKELEIAKKIVDDTNEPNLAQMFGRRSAIQQYPHHTLNHLHKNHKYKQIKQQNSEKEVNERVVCVAKIQASVI